jgi:MoxR-like ATPase
LSDATNGMTPERFAEVFAAAREAVGRAVVGHLEAVDLVLMTLFAGGHCLLEGVPGIGKTLLVRSVAAALELPFSRIQFTPDLMPADIVGTDILSEDAAGRMSLEFRKGPVFGSVVLADEINRATPKTQSALLQAMEEREVTVARETRPLPDPFLVLATQNPLEMEGTYPLPEAQLDRFLVKVQILSPALPDLVRIMEGRTGEIDAEVPIVADGPTVLGMQALARQVIAAPHLLELAGRLVLATHPDRDESPRMVRRVVRYGASPRAALALTLGAKVRALAAGRAHVSEDDLRALALPVLRHRVLLNFEGEADGVSTDEVVESVVEAVRG